MTSGEGAPPVRGAESEINPLVPRVQKIKIGNLTLCRIVEFVKEMGFLALTIVSVRD